MFPITQHHQLKLLIHSKTITYFIDSSWWRWMPTNEKIKVKVGVIFHLAASNVSKIRTESKSSSGLKDLNLIHKFCTSNPTESHSLSVSRKEEFYYYVRFNFEALPSRNLHATAFANIYKFINKLLIREFRLQQEELNPDNFTAKSLQVSGWVTSHTHSHTYTHTECETLAQKLYSPVCVPNGILHNLFGANKWDLFNYTKNCKSAKEWAREPQLR